MKENGYADECDAGNCYCVDCPVYCLLLSGHPKTEAGRARRDQNLVSPGYYTVRFGCSLLSITHDSLDWAELVLK